MSSHTTDEVDEIQALPGDTPEALGISSQRLDKLSEVLCGEIARNTMPGAVAMIGRRGKVAYLKSMGVQDAATRAPMRTDSIFRIFSMTKPIVSLGIMMLVEDGLLHIDEPLAKFIPAFAKTQVAQNKDGRLELVAPSRPITIQDLLRHTSGFAYEFLPSPLLRQYLDAQLTRRDRTNAEHAEALAALPLLCHPGSEWNYGRSVEILGRVIEVVSSLSLGQFLQQRIFTPLGMRDTGFHVDPKRGADRRAEPFAKDPWTGEAVSLFDMMEQPRFESGGGGLVSTALDYARFAHMLSNGGEFEGTRFIGSRTLHYIASNHLDGAKVAIGPLPPGFGFGLGFAVRTQAGAAPFPGSVGQYFWNGSAGTQFWADPAESLWALLMVQAPGQRDHLRVMFRNLVYAALND